MKSYKCFLKVLLVIATLPAPGAEERWLVEKMERPKVTYGKHNAKLVGGGFECQEEMERGEKRKKGKEGKMRRGQKKWERGTNR